MSKTVKIIGDGSDENPLRPDYNGDYQNADYHDDGTVTINPLDDQP